MQKKILLTLTAWLLLSGVANAQWVVTDPTNLAQGIINSVKQIVQATKTTTNVVKGFQETKKIYDQGKKFYDALKSINNLVKDARKVQETVLMIGEISEMYVKNFNLMRTDKNFSPDELTAIAFGYAKLLEEGSNELKDLQNIVTKNGLSMNDSERLAIIDNIHSSVKRYRNLTAYYTRKTISVSYLRSKKSGDRSAIRALYGSQDDRYF